MEEKSPEFWRNKTVSDLREELRTRGLRVSGLKEELVERLASPLKAEPSPARKVLSVCLLSHSSYDQTPKKTPSTALRVSSRILRSGSKQLFSEDVKEEKKEEQPELEPQEEDKIFDKSALEEKHVKIETPTKEVVVERSTVIFLCSVEHSSNSLQTEQVIEKTGIPLGEHRLTITNSE